MTVPAEIRENVPLAPMTTFGVGGPARYFVEAQNEDDLTAALDWARRRGMAATSWSAMKGSMGS
jgi:UDP-N-acetylenolpyruvoylglucosamine reductase